MAFFVLIVVAFPWFSAVRFRRNAVIRPLAFDVVTDFICAICFVAHNNAACKVNFGQHVDGDRAVVNVARCKVQLNRIAKSADNGMDLGVSPAARNPYILVGFGIFSPFLAPAAC